MGRLVAMIILCFFMTPILTSCYDAKEVDEMAYVISVGIDKGISNKYRITFQIPTMKGSSGGSSQSSGEGSGKEYEIFTVDAPSFFGAVNLINTTVSRRLNFMHTKFIVFSEESAKSGHIGALAAGIIRFREIRRTVKVIITRGSAQEFLQETNPVIGTILSKYQETLVNQAEETGFHPYVRLGDLYNSMKGTYKSPIGISGDVNDFKNFKKEGEKWEKPPEPISYYAGEIPRTGGNKIELMGSVIGSGDITTEELDGFETRLLLVARGEIERFIYTGTDLVDPNLSIIIEISQARKPDVKIRFDGRRPIIRLKVQLEGDIRVVQSRANYEEPMMKKELEKQVINVLKPQLDDLIKKVQKKNGDVFKFGYVAARQFWTIQEWESYDWNKHFKDAVVTTEMKFTIRRAGALLKNSPIITSDGEEE